MKSTCSSSTLLGVHGFTGGRGHLWKLLCSGRICLLRCKLRIYECADINGGSSMALGGTSRKPLDSSISYTQINLGCRYLKQQGHLNPGVTSPERH